MGVNSPKMPKYLLLERLKKLFGDFTRKFDVCGIFSKVRFRFKLSNRITSFCHVTNHVIMAEIIWKPMKMTHIWKWPNEKDLLYEKNLRLTLTLQTQERSFKTVYNLMIKEKTITNCRISAERGQSLHRLWSILYLPELFFSNDLFCMNNQTKCFWRC